MCSRLAGPCTERKGDLAPGVEIRRGGRQVQDDPPDGDDHLHAEFEQPLTEPGHLGTGTRGARGPQAEFLHEHVRGGGEEHAQLIGPEATAAGPVDLEPVVEFLDPIFNIPARADRHVRRRSGATAGDS